MKRKSDASSGASQGGRFLDQLTKSEFFHQTLHEWGLLEIATEIEKTKGETLDWDLPNLGISSKAWDKIIHRGIKPIIVFAHPFILTSVSGSVGYYRMLSMVSQKSMNRIGRSVTRYESGKYYPNNEAALALARHVNQIISRLVELSEEINAREFDLWRGMAAGSQAQGSWQNTKGNKVEVTVKGAIQRRLRERELILSETEDGSSMHLHDSRTFRVRR